ncbi:MAG: hypothetical protein A3J07_02100 [Candidatus Doudnabacteria bacterium RIFCSPLOWO2_02_FULL_49_13]|uniref:Uncharacterized protein n=1 Tax=Candidatus Doudnabacteria bacterium RIFCSPHIGHO2_12_FULL_48_16 TaxID=1817838 RepID=A0A1F5PLE0_9BACT|nr:MAG: hypothetical protein A3B77_00610 [Candidatus Doudnabacteria bacterium RIFCSPHIGHO2_02_FULL_49_24]OGE89674.1 MAG: hypothetical protein A2760_00720 [Candidatus Doudnabacteria bacterium RIFCSPHIGHO2_01_FULL_50_67]OGE90726.1 MAG: hypothetical protein A3E29_01200 [Candidatus Doudnabacteria bacterium RIFCSPHIGHO2_12_FULL_48_16]OGE96837.1 MAG: hypothetical protein A2990_03305 [Candidatus Doudnabacteria bacterium RIFCSPLOWO2_01_FULL_49_40]OGF02589.1 MAG: hypothetical protein A3J07_02100 [Candid
MHRNKKKNHNYGTFLAATGRFQKYKRKAVLAVLILALSVAGISAFFRPHNQTGNTLADTKPVDLGLPGWWLQEYFGSSVCDQSTCQMDADPDQDKLTNAQEYFYHTEPLNPYTAKDTLNDGQLVTAGFDPSKHGRVTFEQQADPDNILGESLVFAEDIQKMVADSNDIAKVTLPLVEDDKLQIVYLETASAYNEYSSRMQSAVSQYFPQQNLAGITQILKSGSDAEVTDIKIKAGLLAMELKTIPVPKRFLMFHKYNIAMFGLLSEILPAPTDLSAAGSDAWYDKVQQFLAVQQRLDFEKQFLAKEFPQ